MSSDRVKHFGSFVHHMMVKNNFKSIEDLAERAEISSRLLAKLFHRPSRGTLRMSKYASLGRALGFDEVDNFTAAWMTTPVRRWTPEKVPRKDGKASVTVRLLREDIERVRELAEAKGQTSDELFESMISAQLTTLSPAERREGRTEGKERREAAKERPEKQGK